MNKKVKIQFPEDNKQITSLITFKDVEEYLSLMMTLHLAGDFVDTDGEKSPIEKNRRETFQSGICVGIGATTTQKGKRFFWHEKQNQKSKTLITLEEWFKEKKIGEKTQEVIVKKRNEWEKELQAKS